MSSNNTTLTQINTGKTVVKVISYKIIVLPSSIDLDRLLIKYPIALSYPLGSKIPAIKNRCLLILNQIVQRTALNKDLDLLDNDGYVSLHSNVLKALVSNYKDYLDWLIDVKVIESDNNFILGQKSLGYRFTAYYSQSTTTTKHYIYDSTLVKNRQQCTKTNIKYQALHKDLLQLEVADADFDSTEIKDLIRNQIKILFNNRSSTGKNKNKDLAIIIQDVNRSFILKVLAWKQSIASFQDSTIYFKQDQTSFRLHTNVTGLKKEFRKYLSYNDQKLVAADIKNSQPFMSLVFFNTNKDPAIQQIIDKHCVYLKKSYPKEYASLTKLLNNLKSGQYSANVKQYIQDVTSGQIYEVMKDIWNTTLGLQMTREEAKTEIFKIFFQPPSFTTNKKTVFKNTYPTVYRIIELINHGFKRTKKQKRSLMSKYNFIDIQGNVWACILQNIESYIVLDVVCHNLKNTYPDVPLITVHDSIATTEKNYAVVEAELNHALKKYIGHTPSIRKEHWS